MYCSDEDDDENDEDDDDEDDEGWITPANLKAAKESMRDNVETETSHVEVACLTTDFAMQVFSMKFL